MKRRIVIEIDDAYYNALVAAKTLGKDLLTLEKVVAGGTPLPKGYGDLIDRDALSGEIFCYADITDAHTCFNSIDKIVKDAPTVIEADEEDEYED